MKFERITDAENSMYEKALEFLSCRGKNVLLEIDPPVDETANRRKGFYERCGFTGRRFFVIISKIHMKCR